MPNFDASPPGQPARPPRPVVVTLRGPVTPADVDPACAELRADVAIANARLVVCDVTDLAGCDVGAIDLIARLALTAKACGCRLVLRGARADLRALLVFAGLSDVLPCLEDAQPRSGLEAEG